MATSTYGTPYVQGSDLVSAYPTASSNLATRVDEVSYKRNGLNAQTGTSYTLVVGDAGKTITLSNASAVAVTLPQDSVATLPTGAVVSFYNLGAGTVTISQGTGATLQGGSITLAQYEVTSIIKISANTYGRFDGAPAAGMNPATPTSITNSGGTATLSGNTVTFSAVASVSLNGCFSSTYDNYRVLVNYTAITTSSQDVNMRLRLAGTDVSTNTYYSQRLYGNSTTAAANRFSGVSFFQAPSVVLSEGAYHEWDISAPAMPQRTHYLCRGIAGLNTTLDNYGGANSNATAYDGFTLIPVANNVTGTVSVFGYKK